MIKVLNTRKKNLTHKPSLLQNFIAKMYKNVGSNEKSLSHTATLGVSSSNSGYAAGFQELRGEI